MKTVIVPTPSKVEIRQVGTPVVNAYQVLAKTGMVALCNAANSKLIAEKSLGIGTHPLVLGHESTGIVVAADEEVRNFEMDNRVIGGFIFGFGAQGINNG